MKASVRLREDERKGPLIRAKLPVSVMGLPLVSAAAAGDPADLSLHLRTALSGGPSLKFTYRPNPTPTSDHPFSLSLKSGVGPWGSPDGSPLLISAHLSLPSLLGGGGGAAAIPPSFTIQIKPQIGDFSLKKTAASSPPPNPNPNPSNENGCGVHHPLPLARIDRTGLEDLLSSGVAVSARTTLPVAGRVAVSLRWGVNLSEAAVSGWAGLPYLTVDKISIEPIEKREGEVRRNAEAKEGNAGDLELMKGLCFWMRREVDELQRENLLMKESIEQVRTKVWGKSSSGSSSRRGMEKGGSNHVEFPVDAATAARASSSSTTKSR